MRAYKFLDEHDRSPFTLTPWTPDEWVETATALPCRDGVHACHVEHLSYWLAPTLWEIELDDDAVPTRHKLTARRGRLVARIDDYPAAAIELGDVCTWRARDRAVGALRAGGSVALAEQFTAVSTLESVLALGAHVNDSTFAGTAAALAVDTAAFAIRGPITEAPFIGACAAGHAAAGPNGDQADFDAGFADERAFQSSWLASRLGLG